MQKQRVGTALAICLFVVIVLLVLATVPIYQVDLAHRYLGPRAFEAYMRGADAGFYRFVLSAIAVLIGIAGYLGYRSHREFKQQAEEAVARTEREANEKLSDLEGHCAELRATMQTVVDEVQDELRAAVADTKTIAEGKRAEIAGIVLPQMGESEVRRKARKEFNAGVRAFRAEKTGDAIAHWTESARLYPQAANVHHNLGLAMAMKATSAHGAQAKQLREAAVDAFSRAHELAPDYAQVLGSWAAVLIEMAGAEEGQQRVQRAHDAIAICRKAVELNPDDTTAFLNWGTAVRLLATIGSRQERDARLIEAIHIYRGGLGRNSEHAPLLTNLANVLLESTRTCEGTEAERLYAEAQDLYEQAWKIESDPMILANWGGLLIEWARRKTGDEASDLYGSAATKLHEAAKMVSDPYIKSLYLGEASYGQAQCVSRDEKRSLLTKAVEAYQAASKLNPRETRPLTNEAVSLVALAQVADAGSANELRARAVDRLAKAHRLAPSSVDILNSWGVTLLNWAKTLSGREAQPLFAEAAEKLARVSAARPNADAHLSDWGSALLGLGDCTDREEADTYYKQAIEKYELAARLNPARPQVYFNWAIALMGRARCAVVPVPDAFLTQAEELLKQMEVEDKGRSAYNRACIAALRGDASECERQLRVSLTAKKLPPKERVLRDPDLSSFGDEEWFKRLVRDAYGAGVDEQDEQEL
jgi:tetratricopeptide (TPR) repeat protein